MAEPTDIDNEESADDAWAEALAEQAEVESAQAGGDYEMAPLEELTDESSEKAEDEEGENVNLEMVLDIPVTISMEIGRTQISIRNLLKLNQGSVVELDRLAGEPLDVLVNGTLIAHGEVVVVNEKFGIRLTDVITAMERINKL